MKTNLYVIANVKQLRTDGSFKILLPFFRTSWGVGVLNSDIFNTFHNRAEFGTILEGFRYFGGGLTPPNTPSVPHWLIAYTCLKKFSKIYSIITNSITPVAVTVGNTAVRNGNLTIITKRPVQIVRIWPYSLNC